jgi:hypothetical protein
MVSGNFAEMTPFLRHLRFFNLPQSCDMGRTDGCFTSPLEEGMLRMFLLEKLDGFSRVQTRELWYQRPAC